ncbi:hypothetical protein GALMADRAFT_148896 [Galerina marginata CBS 339.88]|uniref:Uncharacterized protein n=1 Tax=Galerina marginata (strain CBS 339.88) TaxID=685588 RepID=A0A067S5N1_GALM3|nr:hypothetical protein GALMADRAFT_148896 [Galerina marginata CBS 339.88]
MSPLSVFTGSRVLCAMVSWILEIPGQWIHTLGHVGATWHGASSASRLFTNDPQLAPSPTPPAAASLSPQHQAPHPPVSRGAIIGPYGARTRMKAPAPASCYPRYHGRHLDSVRYPLPLCPLHQAPQRLVSRGAIVDPNGFASVPTSKTAGRRATSRGGTNRAYISKEGGSTHHWPPGGGVVLMKSHAQAEAAVGSSRGGMNRTRHPVHETPSSSDPPQPFHRLGPQNVKGLAAHRSRQPHHPTLLAFDWVNAWTTDGGLVHTPPLTTQTAISPIQSPGCRLSPLASSALPRLARTVFRWRSTRFDRLLAHHSSSPVPSPPFMFRGPTTGVWVNARRTACRLAFHW